MKKPRKPYTIKNERKPYTKNIAETNPEIIPLLGTMPDSVLAEQNGFDFHQVRWARIRLKIPAFYEEHTHYGNWTEENYNLLGKIPDAELAKIVGITYVSVYGMRERLGIPLCPANPDTGPKGVNWDQWTPVLGTKPDSEIAKEVGVTTGMVGMARRKRKIPAYKKEFKKPNPAS